MSALAIIAATLLSLAAGFVLARVGILLCNRRHFRVQEFPGFLSDEECAHLIARAEPLMKKSQVHLRGERSDTIDRESATAFIDHGGDPIILGIKQRIAELTDTRIEQQERIQVTHYGPNQFYDPHHDALSSGGLDPGAPGDRVHTVIVYLNDDFQGGATYFPKIRRRVRAEKGKAVFFGNLVADGSTYHRRSIHSGEIVHGNDKWLTNQWIRQHDRNPVRKPTPRIGGQRKRRSRRS